MKTMNIMVAGFLLALGAGCVAGAPCEDGDEDCAFDDEVEVPDSIDEARDADPAASLCVQWADAPFGKGRVCEQWADATAP